MDIRKAQRNDLMQLLELYTQLHSNNIPQLDSELNNLWNKIIEDENHYIFVGIIDGQIISSCVMLVILNLTHNQRPYALIENVITDKAHRNKGYSTQLLNFAKKTALEKKCYKIMLMTGSKDEKTWQFYEKAGYNRKDKTAFIQWLD